VVSVVIGATNGIMYKHLIGKLEHYPFPILRLPSVITSPFLDVGCNWGRWTLAAGKLGYRAVGVDPSLGAIMAAKRVALKPRNKRCVCCGRCQTPAFPGQHFLRKYSHTAFYNIFPSKMPGCLKEVGRVLKVGGSRSFRCRM